MKKNLLSLILLFILCSCTAPASYKLSNDDIILYENNEYLYTDFYVSEGGIIRPNGELKVIGLYPCEMALFLPKPICKLSNDINNDLLFVYGVGESIYVYAKSPFIEPNYSNFQLTRIECDDFFIEFNEKETISDMYKNDNSFSYKELKIENEYDFMAYSCNYPLFLMSIHIIVDIDGNVYVRSFKTSDLYLLKEEYIYLFMN